MKRWSVGYLCPFEVAVGTVRPMPIFQTDKSFCSLTSDDHVLLTRLTSTSLHEIC
jgi:hypothetical protein